jgi:hypothetical protein
MLGAKSQQSNLLELIELLLRQIDAQQEVRDRWFNYYLVISGGTLALAASVLKLFSDVAPRRELAFVISAAFALTAILGYCFLQLYLRQRQNYTRHYRLLAVAQKRYVEIVMKEDYGTFYPTTQPFVARYRGADFYTLLPQVVLSSAYLGASIAALESGLARFDWISLALGALGFLIGVLACISNKSLLGMTVRQHG